MAPDEPDGLGRPSGGEPGFVPPPSAPQPPAPEAGRTPPAAPTPPWPAPAQGDHRPPHEPSQPWPAPAADARFATPPTGRGPVRGRPRRRVLVAGVLAASLALVGILSVLPLVPRPPAPVEPGASPPVLVTTSPSAGPGASATATGGGLGREVAFETAGGQGSLTVVSAVWTDAGELPPPSGQRYLVLEVVVRCSRGELPVDPILFVLETAGEQALPGFGPELADPLGGRVLDAGEQVGGRLGFSVSPGPVTLRLLDPELRPVAAVEVPGP